VTWKTLHASEAGTSHLAASLPCQDAADVRRLLVGGEEFLLIAICDGAGSAVLAHEGAQFVSKHWLDIASVELHLRGILSEEAMVELTECTYEALLVFARKQGRKVRDYACTLLTAVLGSAGSIFFQVGDGVWVEQCAGELSAVTWPHQGDYAGETVFLTSPDRRKHYQITTRPPVEAVAGMTDGLERLALDFAAKKPARGFFLPMWSAVKENEDPSLAAKLSVFLASEQVNNRTDDDKTLVLAVRCDDAGK
jgi:Protein phosphatase 2C